MTDDPRKLTGRARGLAASAIRAARTRIELLGVEIQEEAARVVRDLLLAGMAFGLLLSGLLLGTVWLILAVPPALRGLILGGFSLLFLLVGAGTLLWLRAENALRKPFLDATVTILKGDEEALDKTTR